MGKAIEETVLQFVSSDGQRKYGQIEFFFTSEHSYAKWALVHAFKVWCMIV